MPQMAATIVERLIARMGDARIAPAEFLFQPLLIERESVAPPPQLRKAKV